MFLDSVREKQEEEERERREKDGKEVKSFKESVFISLVKDFVLIHSIELSPLEQVQRTRPNRILSLQLLQRLP